ncbi:MAG: universal stress protein [Pirellulaceae bacterium]
MKRFKNILVATDTRFDSHPAVDEAVDIALQSGAKLKIVDVVPEFSWTVRLTMKDHEHMRELMSQEKQEKLDAMIAPLRDKGIDVQAKVLSGKTSVEVIREVMRDDHDLVLRVNKGKESRRKGFFGNTGMRLLRKCPCAVWLIVLTRPQFQHVLGCVDTTSEDKFDAELNDEVFELAKSISHHHGGTFSIAHAWSVLSESFLKNRMDHDDFVAMMKDHRDHAAKLFDRFLLRHGSNIDAENVYLGKGDVSDVVSELIRRHSVDLVVMGTIARSGMSGIVMGNTAEKILDRMECSVLALKPSDFVCPIQMKD